MPQLPYNPIATGGQPGSANIGFQSIDGVTPDAFGAPQGRAMQSFGQEMSKMFGVLADVEITKQRETAESDVVRLSNDFFQRQETDLIERQRSTTGDASGFTKSYMENFNRERERLLSTINDPVRRNAIDARLAPSVRQFATRAFQSELQLRDTFEGSQLDQRSDQELNALQQGGGADFAARRDRSIERVQASTLPESEKARRIEVIRTSFATAAALGIMQNNPAALAGAMGGATPWDEHIIQKESSGNPRAWNRRSTAAGLGQFLAGTWNSVANSPEGQAAGLRPTTDNRSVINGQVSGPPPEDDPRFDASQSRIALRLYRQRNAGILENAGFQATPQNLAMSHLLGAGGAISFLRQLQTNPDAPASSVVSAGAVAANARIFEGKTVSQAYSIWSGSFANAPSGGSVNPEIIRNIPPNQFAQIRDRAEREAARQTQQAVVQQNNQRYLEENQILVQLNAGQIGRAALEAAQERGLFTHINRIQQFENIANKIERQDQSFQRFQQMAQSGAVGSGLNADDRAASEAGYQRIVASDVDQFSAIGQTVQATGVIPESGVRAIRGGLNSNNINTVRQAYNAMEVIMGAGMRPDMFQGIANGEELRQQFKTLQAIRSTAGSTDVADQLMMQHIQQVNSPEWASFRQYRDGLAKDEIKRTEQEPAKVIGDIRTALGVGVVFNRAVQSTPQDEARMLQDYRTIYVDMVGRSGNPEAARKQTLELMRETWAVSRSPDGTQRIMKFAIETRYPPNPFDRENPHGYVYTHAQERLAQMGVNVPTGQIFLLPVVGTDRQFRESGGIPQYRITYRDANGFMQAGPVFERFDPQTRIEAARQVQQAEENRIRAGGSTGRTSTPAVNPRTQAVDEQARAAAEANLRARRSGRLGGFPQDPAAPTPGWNPLTGRGALPNISIQKYNGNPLE